MKSVICRQEHCTWYKVGPDPQGNPMVRPTCHHPTTEDFEMVFPLMDVPAGACKCRHFKAETDDSVIIAKIEEHACLAASALSGTSAKGAQVIQNHADVDPSQQVPHYTPAPKEGS